MPNFNLRENDLVTRLDKWLYFIKHLEDFQTIPTIFTEELVFEEAFEKAELARFDNIQWESYESSLKEYRDIKGYIDTAFHDGKAEVAKKLKDKGMDIDFIVETTGLTKQEIDKL
jgi:predicted transposase/invertase (TIGR01784 family)